MYCRERLFLVKCSIIPWLFVYSLLGNPILARSQPDRHGLRLKEPAAPVFARILGVRLAVDMEAQLEGMLGEGQVMIGGHSNSGREWVLPNGLILYADGFDLRNNHYVLDTLLFRTWKGPLGKTKILNRFGSGVWGRLRVGMTVQECLRALPSSLPKPAITADAITWQQDVSGARQRVPGRFHYEAAVLLKRGRLRALRLVGDWDKRQGAG